MTQYIIYFPNTKMTAEIQADTWSISNDDILSFKKDTTNVATFNFKNILGFKEIVDEHGN